MRLNDLIDEYYEARAAHDRAHEESSRLHRILKGKEYDLIDEMLNQGIPSIKRDDGTTVSLRKQVSLSCTKENSDQIRDWIMTLTGDDSDFVEETVSKTALTELVKQKLEEGLDTDDFPPYLKLSTRPGISVRGLNNKS